MRLGLARTILRTPLGSVACVRTRALIVVLLPSIDSHDVQLAAINALYNSLEFVRENFSREVRHVPLLDCSPARSTGLTHCYCNRNPAG